MYDPLIPYIIERQNFAIFPMVVSRRCINEVAIMLWRFEYWEQILRKICVHTNPTYHIRRNSREKKRLTHHFWHISPCAFSNTLNKILMDEYQRMGPSAIKTILYRLWIHVSIMCKVNYSTRLKNRCEKTYLIKQNLHFST